MYKSKIHSDVKNAISADRKLQKRVFQFIAKQYLKPSTAVIYRLAIEEWLNRNEKRLGKPRGRRPL